MSQIETSVSRTESTEQEKLVRYIILLNWIVLIFYSILDLFNKSYASSAFMGIGSFLINPLCFFLLKTKKANLAKLILLTNFSLAVFVATVTTPYDDGGRFYFVPISLLTILIFDLSERKSYLYGLFFPFFCYFVSLNFELPSFLAETKTQHLDADLSKQVNFVGIYIITIVEVYFFTKSLQKLREVTAHQSKFSALGIMASGIAHEINNPLSVIKGKAHILKKNVNNSTFNSDSFNKDLDIISKTTDRIYKIVKGLRSFARDASEDPFEKVSTKTLIQASLDLCNERFQQLGIQVSVIENTEFEIKCREPQIVQVLVNLLSNSFDAIQSLDEKWIKIEVNPYEISVTDSGSGIPKAVANKLMQPFFTTKEAGKGVGLGLSISKGIIDDHGGAFFLDSESKNTKFVIRFTPPA